MRVRRMLVKGLVALVLTASLTGCPSVTTVVPDVRNMEFSAAEAALKSANLTLGDATGSYSDTVVQYLVISQDPAPDVPVTSGTPVNVVVSMGVDPGNSVADGLTPEQTALADAAPSAQIDWNKVVLPDGTLLGDSAKDSSFDVDSTASWKATQKDVVGDMLRRAWELCDRTRWIYPDQGPNKPAQPIGLAYVWGGKHPELRTQSTDSCAELLHGLDGSGFVYQCAKSAGISLPTGPPSLQGQANTWNNAIPPAWQLTMGTVVPGTPLQSGDIICWGTHIGIVINDGASLYVAQSNGQPDQCSQNQSITRGPRIVPYSVILGWFTQTPTILRIITPATSLAGWWGLTISNCSTGGPGLQEFGFVLYGNGTWEWPRPSGTNITASSWSLSGVTLQIRASAILSVNDPHGTSVFVSYSIEIVGTVNPDGSYSGTYREYGFETRDGVTNNFDDRCSMHMVRS